MGMSIYNFAGILNEDTGYMNTWRVTSTAPSRAQSIYKIHVPINIHVLATSDTWEGRALLPIPESFFLIPRATPASSLLPLNLLPDFSSSSSAPGCPLPLSLFPHCHFSSVSLPITSSLT